MATQDTGLGWYADGDWLTNQSGDIGTISTASGDVPLEMPAMGINPGWSASQYNQNICANGVMVGTGTLGDYYVVSDSSRGGPVYIAHLSDMSITGNGFIIASTYDTARVYIAGTRPQTGNNYDYMDVYYSGSSRYYYYRGYHVRYAWSSSPQMRPNIFTCPDFFDYEDFVDALIDGGLTTTTAFAKSTSGYSVTCMCKWKSELGGDVYCSPVLISSVENNTLYTRNSATPSVLATQHTFQDMTFYMRKAPLDVVDGTETITSNFPVLDYSSSPPLTNDMLFALIASASSLGVGTVPQPEDPYGDGGHSGPSDADGTFDDSSDTISDSSLPTFSFAATGFSRIYNPTLAQLNSLANYMWTDPSFLQTVINHLKQLLENPMDAVISLSRVPVTVPQGASEEVKVMYIPTGVYMPPATTQFVDVDCGSLFIDEFYGSALDYNPYTKVSLYLPFVGMVNLDTDEVMNKNIYVKYRVDIVSGACVAKVFVGSVSDNSCLYQYSGDCSMSMPINSADFSGYKAAVISAAKVVSLGVAAAGSAIAGAASAAGFEAATSGGAEMTFTEEQSGQYERAMSNISTSLKNTPERASFEDAAKKEASNTVGSVIGSKVEVEHSGGFSGNTGVLGIRRPYAVIKRPDMCNPEQYGKYNGRPCQMYLSLGALSGYTEVQSIQLTGFSATNPELAEIAKLLKGGVIL